MSRAPHSAAAIVGRRHTKRRRDDVSRFVIASLCVHGVMYVALRGASPRRYFAEPFSIASLEMQLDFARPLSPLRPASVVVRDAQPLARVVRRANSARPNVVSSATNATVDPSAAVAPAAAQPVESPANVSRPALSGMRFLESVERDAWTHRGSHTFSTTPTAPVADPGVRTLDQNVSRVRDDWREQSLRAAPPPRPSGSSDFVRQFVTETARVWNPTRAQDPDAVEGLYRLLTAGVPGYRAAMQDMLGGFGSPRGSAAGEALDSAHPNSPMLRPNPTLNEAGRATAQRIAVELDVTQAADGSITSVRVARTSGSRWFDSQAESAVRSAVARTAAGSRTPRASGLRSRWEFELRVARNPPIALGPQLPGAAPVINLISGGVEYGGVDPPRPMYPFALHRYQRIRILWLLPDGPTTASAAPQPGRDGGT